MPLPFGPLIGAVTLLPDTSVVMDMPVEFR